uniref:Uncharacterized protein n=1 Tax=Neogobius melanostomus TaxID=47308 RepID=A0A8C6UG89_9GOBI
MTCVGVRVCCTDVLVPLDVFQHGPLFVEAVVSSVVGVGLELFDGGGAGSARAHLVHRGGHSLTQPGLHCPDLPEHFKQHRLHAGLRGRLRRLQGPRRPTSDYSLLHPRVRDSLERRIPPRDEIQKLFSTSHKLDQNIARTSA